MMGQQINGEFFGGNIRFEVPEVKKKEKETSIGVMSICLSVCVCLLSYVHCFTVQKRDRL